MSKLPATWRVHITFGGRPISLGLSPSLLRTWQAYSWASLCPSCPQRSSVGELAWQTPAPNLLYPGIYKTSFAVLHTCIQDSRRNGFAPQCFALPSGNLLPGPLQCAPWSHSFLFWGFRHDCRGSSLLLGGLFITLLSLLPDAFLRGAPKLFSCLEPGHCSETPVFCSDY